MIRAVSAALDEVEDLKEKLKAANEAIEELQATVAAAKAAIEAGGKEREAHERVMTIAERAIAQQQKLIETLFGALDKALARVDKLEDKLDRANKRTLWGTLGGLVLGILSRAL